MGTLNSDKAWIASGKKNPYFGVLTDDKYLDKNLSEETLKDFFATGKDYVDTLFATIHNQIDPNFKPRTVLDFGCGTGRLVIPFAKRAENVVGLDISKDILDIAKLNAEKSDLKNIQFYLSDDSLTKISDKKFDLINSYIVLQHINVERGQKIIQLMLKLLSPNGVGAIHVTYFNDRPKVNKAVNFFRTRIPFLHNVLNIATGKPVRSPLMQMNAYDLNYIFFMLQREGIENCYVSYTNHGDALGTKLIFQKK